jgi:diguanylate cyclase (GGDEF)-like protein
MSSLWAYLLLTVAYIVLGKLGLMLALPPGYASPIFPSAGIAVAAVLIAGRKSLPWILIASLLLNIWVAYSANPQLSNVSLMAALIIAIASMSQAAIGGWGLRRLIGYPAPLAQGADILRFLIWTPFFCLTSAGISVTGLVILGLVNPTHYFSSVASWWAGGTLGVLVMFPLVMIVAGEPRALWKCRSYTIAIPIVLTFAFFVGVFLKANQLEQKDSLSDFRQYSFQVAAQIKTQLEQQEFVLEETAGFLNHDSHTRVSSKHFQYFTQNALQRYPMIQAVSWVPKVNAANREAFELSQQHDFPGYAIRERNAEGAIQRAGSRQTYYPVTYIEPLAGNEAAVGFDLTSNSRRQQAINKAVQTGAAVISAPLTLVQEQQQQSGVLMIYAIKEHADKMGLVTIVLRISDFIEPLLQTNRTMLSTRLIDLDEQQVIFDNFASEAKQAVLMTQSFEFGTRHYRLENAPTPAYLAQHQGWQSWWVLASGVLGIGLMGSFLLFGTGYTSRLKMEVAKRTKLLKESEDQLLEAQHLAKLGSWSVIFGPEESQDKWAISNELREIWGHTETQGIDAQVGFANMPPEDQELTQRYWAAAKQGTGPAEWDHRILVNGEIKWLHVVSHFTFDAQGKPLAARGTNQDITLARHLEEEIRQLAFYDPLTNLPNRRLLNDRLGQIMSASKRSGLHGALMFIDLDNFKRLNDTHGHKVGDLLLIEAAARLKNCVRGMDSVARFGGDEFVVILSELGGDKTESTAQANHIAENILAALSEPYLLSVSPESAVVTHRCTASIGVAVFIDHEDSQDNILKWADAAMYQAKKLGRNQLQFYEA